MHVVCMIACFVYTKWNNYLQFQYFSREVPASYGEPLGYLLQLCLGTLLANTRNKRLLSSRLILPLAHRLESSTTALGSNSS